MQEVEFRAQACRFRRYHQRVCRFLQKFTSILFPPLNDFILKRGQDGIAASLLPALTGWDFGEFGISDVSTGAGEAAFW